MENPTPFADLNSLLMQLVDGVRGLLGENLLGIYLQGSFALGEGDAFSDCDFVVVLREDVPDDEIGPLQAFHAELAQAFVVTARGFAVHRRRNEWASHLEGSYIPAGVLCSLAGAPTEVPGQPRPPEWRDPAVGGRSATCYPTWFLGNGSTQLVRSEHDNSQVIRWVLREHGVSLFGPPPHEFVDPVGPDDLRAEIREVMASVGSALLDRSIPLDQAWLQGFIVVLFARALHTIQSGAVYSKPASIAWAKDALAPVWRGLLERSWLIREGQVRGVGSAERNGDMGVNADDAEATLRFVRMAMDRAGLR